MVRMDPTWRASIEAGRSGFEGKRATPSRDSKPPKRHKARLSILPARPLRAIAAAFEHGLAKGYERDSWRAERDDWRDEYGSALQRHVTSYLDPGEPNEDDESGLHHLAHAGACVMILLWREGVDWKRSKLAGLDPQKVPIWRGP